MCRESWERAVMHVSWCMLGSLTSGFLWIRWRGKRSQHSLRKRDPQCYVSVKRPMSVGWLHDIEMGTVRLTMWRNWLGELCWMFDGQNWCDITWVSWLLTSLATGLLVQQLPGLMTILPFDGRHKALHHWSTRLRIIFVPFSKYGSYLLSSSCVILASIVKCFKFIRFE